MKNVLVTGGAGFIGSNFIRIMLKAEPEINIVNLDALTYSSNSENLKDLSGHEQYVFDRGDICDRMKVDNIMRSRMIDTVVHFAAETHVDRSILDPGQFIQANVVGTFTLLESAQKFWIEEKSVPVEKARFHHVSTDEVYGSLKAEEPAWDEKTSYAPNSPYSASKAASDHLVRAYGHTYGLPYSITNCSNNYGPYQFPEKLIPLTIMNAMEGRHLPIYGDGKQIRDWLHVEDHCEAIRLVLHNGTPGETYNIGGNNQPTNLTVVQLICDCMDRLLPDSHHAPHRDLITFISDRPGHDRRYAMDASKIRKELGWKPGQTLEHGLLQTVDWYLNHQQWIYSITNNPDYKRWMDKNYSRRNVE